MAGGGGVGSLKDAFYRLWTRTEAFAKCTGDGIFGERPELADEDGSLLNIVEWKGNVKC